MNIINTADDSIDFITGAIENISIGESEDLRIRKFPSYFAMQVHPENPILEVMRKVITIYMDAKEKVDQRLALHSDFVESLIDEPEFILDNKNCDEDTFDDNYSINFSTLMVDKIQALTASHLPPETIGYVKAIRYIESFLLQMDLNRLTEVTIIDFLKKMNSEINGVSQSKSSYRDRELCIFDILVMPYERNKDTFRQLDNYIRIKASPPQFEVWKNSLRKKIWDSEFSKAKKQDSLAKLTLGEFDVLKLIAVIPPPPEDVKKLMEEFVSELCKKLQEETDLCEFAGWVHHQFTSIHPFMDGNGRTARLLMGFIFMQAGKEPLLIDNDINYTRACKKNDPAAFAAYLRELELKQVKLNTFLEKCFRSLVDNTALS